MKGDEKMKDYIPRHIRKIINLDHQKIDKEMPLQMLPTNLEDIKLELVSPELRQESLEACLVGDEIHCNQSVMVRSQTDGGSKVLWSLMNLGELIESPA